MHDQSESVAAGIEAFVREAVDVLIPIVEAIGAVIVVMRAPLSKAPARALAAHAGLALELFLAAGVIRLAALDSMRALAMVAAIIAVRQVIVRGVREAKA